MTERKRNASETFMDKDDMKALLLAPKSIKNEYVEQKPAKYVFKCMDGDIHVPEYGISRTEFYYQDQITYSLWQVNMRWSKHNIISDNLSDITASKSSQSRRKREHFQI